MELHIVEIIYPGILEKFKQNEAARNVLLNTGVKQLGEATVERFWGIGMRLSDRNVLDTKRWKRDENIVGKMLMKVRDELNRLGCY